jgi:multidrug resistance efflux pump
MQQASSWIRILVTVVVVAAAGVAGWYLWRTYEESPWTRDGRVRVNVVMVAPDVAGAVTDIRVKDNQSVRIGDTLFVIDPARYRLAWSRRRPCWPAQRACSISGRKNSSAASG